MLMGTSQKLLTINLSSLPMVTYERDQIEFVNQFTLLGMEIDRSLTFVPHVEKVLSRVNRNMYFLRAAQKLKLPNFWSSDASGLLLV